MTNDTKFKALKEILYGAGISFILGMIGYVLMFFFKLIAARHFGPSDFGMYEMVVTIFGVAVVISSFGFKSTIQRFASFYISEKKLSFLKGYRIFCLRFSIISSIILGLLLFLFSNQITVFFNFPHEFSLFIKIISMGVFLKNIKAVFSNFLYAEKKPFQASFGYNVIERLVLVLGILVIVYFDLSLIWMVITLILSLFISLLITSFFYFKLPKINYKPKYEIRGWIIYSYPLLFTAFLAYIFSWTDNFVIGRYLTSTELGLYGVSYSMAQYIPFLATTLGILFIPVMTSLYYKDKKNFNEVFKQVTKWVFSGAIFLGFIFVFFSKQILNILFGLEFLPGKNAFIILTIFFVFMSVFSFRKQVLLITKKTKFILYNSLFWSLFNLILNILLVQKYGIEGVALASGFSFFMLRFSEFIKTKKLIEIRGTFLIYVKLILIGLFSIFIIKLLFTYIFNFIFISTIIKLIIALIIYTLIFGFLIILLKILNKEDIKLMLLIEKKSGINLGIIKKHLRRFI